MREQEIRERGWRIDDLLIGGLKVVQNPNDFCFGIDAVLLAHFVAVQDGQRIVDFGTGCGVIPLILSARANLCVTAIDIQTTSVEVASASVSINQLGHRIFVQEADVRQICCAFKRAAFDGCVCNPPYYRVGQGKISPNHAKAIARHELCCTIEDVLAAARYVTTERGFLALIHRAERYPEIVTLLPQFGWHIARRRFVHSRKGEKAQFVLLDLRRDAQPCIEYPSLYIYQNNRYSDEVLSYYNLDRE